MSNTLAIDTKGLDALKGRASRDPQGAIKEAAKQFETLFMQEVMKRMRAASLDTGLLDNQMTQLGTEMLDQQYAAAMAGQPGGLSAAIERQLAGGVRRPSQDSALSMSAAGQALPPLAKKSVPGHVASFIKQHEEAAAQVSAETGIPAQFMLAQAAHETGWGRAAIKMRDGGDSHNLFGIKAGANWKGKVAEVRTTEYVDGVARKVTAKFRAYDSPADAFRDYANLLSSNRRYASAVQAAQTAQVEAPQHAARFAQQLQKAGYATDPAYADKLTRVINTTVRVQRALA